MPLPRDGEDTRLVVERLPRGGYLVTEFMGQRPVHASTDVAGTLAFLRSMLEAMPAPTGDKETGS